MGWDSSSPLHISSLYENHCTYLLPMLGWWTFSALLSSYNKFVMGEDYMNFPFPLLLTCMHFGLQFVFSWTLSNWFPQTLGGSVVSGMSWREWFCVGVPCGLVTCLDIGLSNMAMVYITLTFYTMVKSSSPIFVLASAHIFGVEQVTYSLLLTVLIIAVGEFVVVMGEAQFHWGGFLLCAMASVLSGIRWTLVQLKLQNLFPPLPSSVATMRVLSPSMFCSMLFFSMVLERPWEIYTASTMDGNETMTPSSSSWEPSPSAVPTLWQEEIVQTDTPMWNATSMTTTTRNAIDLTTRQGVLLGLALGLGGAVLAICMILCEFILIMNSNAIVLMIGGVLKEVVTIFVGVIYFHNHLALVNFLGCLIVLMGVALYKVFHHWHRLEAQHHEQKEEEEEGLRTLRIVYNPISVEMVPQDDDPFEDDDEGAHVKSKRKEMPWNVVQIREVVANGNDQNASTSNTTTTTTRTSQI